MLTKDMLDSEHQKLRQVSEALTPLTDFFKTSAASVPLSVASYDNDEQKQAAQQEIKQSLIKLSDERAEIIFEEIALSLRASKSALNRVHLLLHHRSAIYTDGDIERCVRDIMLHQNQSGFHVERAAGMLPTAQSHVVNIQNRSESLSAELPIAMAQYQASLKDIEAQVNLPPDTKPNAPSSDDAQARALFAQISFDLSQLNREILEKASQRIRNALAYVELINVGLLPYGMGVEKDWSEQKVLLLQESMNSFNTFLDHINGAKGYLVQAEGFIQE